MLTRSPSSPVSSAKIRSGIAFSLGLAFVVMTAIAFYGDLPRMLASLAQFCWEYLPLILGFTTFNYGWRFVKWEYYLKRLQIRLPVGTSLLIFLSGLSMAITPGKVGELLKSYFLKRVTGVSVSRTSPIIVAERLTDGVAMLGLASTGLVLYRFGWELLLALLFIGLTGIVLIQNRRLSLSLLEFGEREKRLPGIARVAHWLRAFYESSYTLLQWRPLLLAILIGVVSWSGECVALYFVFRGLGVPGSTDLLIKTMFILAVSSLIGSASGLPGGLGTADGSMLGLTRLLVSASATLGGAATLLIRLCTLWYGLLIGVCAVILFRFLQRVGASQKEVVSEEAAEHKENAHISPVDERKAVLAPASAAGNTGETVV